jgi:hypothetical protein
MDESKRLLGRYRLNLFMGYFFLASIPILFSLVIYAGITGMLIIKMVIFFPLFLFTATRYLKKAKELKDKMEGF